MKVRIRKPEFDTLAAWIDPVVMRTIEELDEDPDAFGDYGKDLMTALIHLSAEFDFVDQQLERNALNGLECVWLWFTCITQEPEIARLVRHMFHEVVPNEYAWYVGEFLESYVTFAVVESWRTTSIGA